MHFFRRQHDAWVGGINSIDVGIDLADVGFNRGSDSDGGEVGSTATQGRYFAAISNALKSCYDHYFSFFEAF